MSRRDTYQEMLGKIGQYLNIPELDFDEEGLCFLEIDTEENKKHLLFIRRNDEHRRLVIMVELYSDCAASNMGLLKAALSFNFAQTLEPMPSMGMNDENGSLLLFQCFPLSEYSEGGMVEEIDRFFSWFQDCLSVGDASDMSEHEENLPFSEIRLNLNRLA